MTVIRDETRQRVIVAATNLRRVRGRSTEPERQALGEALRAAQAEVDAAVAREYPGLMHWRIPAPSIYNRWVGSEESGGWYAWRSAGELAAAAVRWLDRGPAYAAARAAQAYGLSATLGGQSDPSLALRDYGVNAG